MHDNSQVTLTGGMLVAKCALIVRVLGNSQNRRYIIALKRHRDDPDVAFVCTKPHEWDSRLECLVTEDQLTPEWWPDNAIVTTTEAELMSARRLQQIPTSYDMLVVSDNEVGSLLDANEALILRIVEILRYTEDPVIACAAIMNEFGPLSREQQSILIAAQAIRYRMATENNLQPTNFQDLLSFSVSSTIKFDPRSDDM
jgi:hypothetical protein